MLGRAFVQEAQGMPDFVFHAPGKGELDVCDADAMLAAAAHAADGWVVHAAARVDVEACEREPDKARELIVGGTVNAILLARRSGARLFYPQSFLIYDGSENPIGEKVTPRPLSLYGELKYEAEQLIRSEMGDALIVRMAGFFGGESADKNFVGRIIPRMFAALREGKTSFAVGNRVWQPSWTRDLAANGLHMMLALESGVFQMASHGYASFADVAHEIVLALGWSDYFCIETVEADSVSGHELGQRPDVAILDCHRLRERRLDLQRDWRATLHAYLRLPYFDPYRLKGVR